MFVPVISELKYFIQEEYHKIGCISSLQWDINEGTFSLPTTSVGVSLYPKGIYFLVFCFLQPDTKWEALCLRHSSKNSFSVLVLVNNTYEE